MTYIAEGVQIPVLCLLPDGENLAKNKNQHGPQPNN